MKKYYLLILFLFSSYLLSAQYQYCQAGLFSEHTYFSEISIEHDTDVIYGANLDYQGNMQNLLLDIHYPNLLIDPAPKRPVIVMIHGGGFTAGNKNEMTAYCNKLARAGYVAVSINYRVGWNYIGAGGNCGGNMQHLQFAMYRALQDVKSGIRYLVEKASDYKIDTGYIFLAGQSEGGMTAINAAYMNQAEADLLLPGASADLGSIDSASNQIFNAFSIKGIFNWCGAILDTNMIQNDSPVPVLSIHGLLDSIMPVEYGPYLNCVNANNPYPTLYGPKLIYQRMKNLGICSEANFDANGEHCFFPSLEQHVYIPAKFTCFFKNLMCGNCITESKVSYNQKSCVESAPAGLNELTLSVSPEIFPNPAEEKFSISFVLAVDADIFLELIDVTGSQVASVFKQKISKGAFKQTFSRENSLPAGIYCVKMHFNDQIIYKKLIFN